MKDSILLATFIDARPKVSSVLKCITENFEVVNNKVFLLRDVKENTFVLTYNVIKKEDMVFSDIIRNTISLHRKKDINVLYTLNALNEVVYQQNGDVDFNFTVDWSEYKNCILITKNEEDGDGYSLYKIETELVKVFNLR